MSDKDGSSSQVNPEKSAKKSELVSQNVRTAKLQWDSENQPYSCEFDDVYYSTKDGLDESKYVFIDGNELSARWQELYTSGSKSQTFTIAETGFGTGLNFLSAWQHWNQIAEQNAPQAKNIYPQLHFISVEGFPLSSDQLSRAHQNWPELSALSEVLCDAYPPQPWKGVQTLFLRLPGTEIPPVRLTLIFADVKQAFDLISIRSQCGPVVCGQRPQFGESPNIVDAWFLDGFAPSKNPDMWRPELFAKMAQLSDTQSTLATFTAAGYVRRALESQGFICCKRKGFGYKREMLTAQFQAPVLQDLELTNQLNQPNQSAIKPNKSSQRPHSKTRTQVRNATDQPTWPYIAGAACGPLAANLKQKVRSDVVIVGAGIAGCHTARALADRGFQVSLIDEGKVASGASGNLQGAVYTRLSTSDEPLSEWNRASQVHADSFYHNNALYRHCGEACGVLHLAIDAQAAKRLRAFSDSFSTTSSHSSPPFRYLNTEQASNVAGIKVATPALLSSRSGWLNPQKLCTTLIEHPNIQLHEYTRVTNLKTLGGKWQIAVDARGGRQNNAKSFIESQFCVLANAQQAKSFELCDWLPLQSIRGQVSHVQTSEVLSKIRTVICGEGYIPPAASSIHCIGATFTLRDQSRELSDDDHNHNIKLLQNAIPTEFDAAQPSLNETSPGKVGFRCSTPDYLPLVGPVPNKPALETAFAWLKKKANADIDHCGPVYPGLYACLGFGSRGLAYTPLAAEIVASLISGDTLPIRESLYRYVHPSRFLIRSLIKNKTI